MLRFRAPRDGDAEAIAAGIRAADVAECSACGTTPLAALKRGIEDSVWVLVAEDELGPVAAFGVAPVPALENTGAPWMLGTDRVAAHRRAFITAAPVYIALMRDTFSHLLNVVHAKNTTAAGWLRRAGFELSEARPYGPKGEAFHWFT